MRRTPETALLGFSLLALLPVSTWAAPAKNYPETGRVLEAKAGRAHEHLYKVETETRIYKLLCYRRVLLGSMYAECSLNNKPLAANDEVHLRGDGKTIFMDAGNGKEQTLSILLEEAKTLPSLQAPAGAGVEGAVVLARGRELSNQSDVPSNPSPIPSVPPSTSSTTPIGPVIVIPSTGGAPVLVTPTGPVTGGVVTGVSTTGQPVTGVATSPISSPSAPATPVNVAGPSSTGPAWMEVVYLQTESHIYRLACSAWDCELAGSRLALGDLLVARIAGKWAYVSVASATGRTKEKKFRILSTTRNDEAPSLEPL